MIGTDRSAAIAPAHLHAAVLACKRAAVIALACLGLGACATPYGGDGLGGSGRLASGDGLGGTGILGPITALGSIEVNGLHIAVDDRTAVAINGGLAGAHDLRVGQIVAVRATGPLDNLRASSIGAWEAVRGPVSRVVGGHTLQVLGHTVLLDPTTAIAAELPRVDEWVSVYGYRRPDGVILATRVAPTAPGQVRSTGIIAARGRSTLRIDGQNYLLPAGSPGRVGDHVSVDARLVGSTPQIEHVHVHPEQLFAGEVRRVIAQGFVTPEQPGATVRLGVTVLNYTAAVDESFARPALIDAVVNESGELEIARVITDRPVLPESDEVIVLEPPQTPDTDIVETDAPERDVDAVGAERPPEPVDRVEPPEKPEPIEPPVRPEPIDVPERPESPPIDDIRDNDTGTIDNDTRPLR